MLLAAAGTICWQSQLESKKSCCSKQASKHALAEERPLGILAVGGKRREKRKGKRNVKIAVESFGTLDVDMAHSHMSYYILHNIYTYICLCVYLQMLYSIGLLTALAAAAAGESKSPYT